MPTKITVTKNASYRIECEDMEIYDANGNKYDLAGRTTIGLCRCGQSSKKPFCDGSHKACGFESDVVAFALEPKKQHP
ncbi:MAG: CDGSH iron-sulfur domain-containing protein [Ignavibacteria bacterium]|nr:CDGSH iron-sulfur domain-containing protein [Ignavibacteria bacterium]